MENKITSKGKTPLAIGLLSGGLDSVLAAKVIQRQGIRVLGYQFISPFFGWGKRGRETQESEKFLDRYGIELRIRPIWPEYLDIVRAPRFGYGRNLNPCLDCKIFMLRLAAEEMPHEGASFVFTGEVLGQRPMSQRRDALHLIENNSGLKGRLVRPLSAKLLPPSLPEQEGILDREGLLDFKGRSRKPQMELAARLDITDYQTPAGGCLLTDPGFASRLRKMLDEGRAVDPTDIELLSVGRHFKLGPAIRLVVGRKESENDRISALAGEDDLLIKAQDIPGPVALLRGPANEGQIDLAAGITVRYADHQDRLKIAVLFTRGRSTAGRKLVSPALPADIEQFRI